MAPRVIGLDLSLTSTGVASSAGWCDRIKPAAGLTGLERLRFITSTVGQFVRCYPVPELVVVEGLAYSSTTGAATERGALWWFVVNLVDQGRLPYAVVPPTCRAKYATGKGNAPKDQVMLAAAKRYAGWDIRGNDEADAVILAAMGADWLGQPVTEVPALNRAALAGCRWPDLAGEVSA